MTLLWQDIDSNCIQMDPVAFAEVARFDLEDSAAKYDRKINMWLRFVADKFALSPVTISNDSNTIVTAVICHLMNTNIYVRINNET